MPDPDDHPPAVDVGDLQLAHVWWDGTEVTGLLDLERARLAPPYTELGHVQEQAEAEDEQGEAHRQLFAILLREYPALAVPS